MKKTIISVFMLICSISINAQWFKQVVPADELKGTAEPVQCKYEDDDKAFVYTNNTQICIGIKNAQFDWYRSGNNEGMTVTVGIYTADDKLQEKFTMWLDSHSGYRNTLISRNMSPMFNPVGQKKKIAKILNALQNTDGYVRIIAGLYGKGDFDLKIPNHKGRN